MIEISAIQTCAAKRSGSRSNHTTLQDMLRHPGYAGAYVYGRRHTDHRLQLPGKPHSGRRIPRRSRAMDGAAPRLLAGLS